MRAALFTSIENKEIIYNRDAAKNYNGVDIAKNRKTKKVVNFAHSKNSKTLINYITKYISKNEQQFEHLAYHCSRDYSNLIISIRITDAELQYNQLLLLTDTAKIFENEWITFYPWLNSPPQKVCRYMQEMNNIVLKLITLN